ncbi:ATP-grasp domain-containing protein [Succiniclasticum ruminis]|uniref:ATP-grasp domain-containing protein n=1 Tax=Succiniclasticum ruminis TaxID=40841 RepID=A0A1G6HME2_9FIRM|nr:ATP-grasp domain-containing protein [Succiniclasticum ruminis]SDB95412.1 ATP-grasp domain-containing protein [Succiniclasticum ruminis]
MKRILVTAGGTATAWHIATIAKRYFSNEIILHVCDTNESYLVPVSVIADKTHKVPSTIDRSYPDVIKKIVIDEQIDCIIPLIPYEGLLFANDADFIKKLNIGTTAASMKTTRLLADKANMYKTLATIGIPTPRLFQKDEVDESNIYLLKPRQGFGSSGVEIVTGKDIIVSSEKYNLEDNVISEYCHADDYDEITVEIYNGREGLFVFPRRRIATKAGVCTKMEPVHNHIFYDFIKKLVRAIKCPLAFNAQFLFHEKQWKLFDCNLRLGAGTALSTAAGFQLTRALLAELVEQEVKGEFFKVDNKIKSVLRVYQEIAIK